MTHSPYIGSEVPPGPLDIAFMVFHDNRIEQGLLETLVIAFSQMVHDFQHYLILRGHSGSH